MMMKARSNQRTAELTIDIPISLRQSLEDEARRASTTPSAVVCTALARHLGVSLHTLFQISTSGALVTGVYSGAITVRQLLAHGDFGLGTFQGLDGEMVVLDGAVYRVRGSGEVSQAAASALAPFAVITRFAPGTDEQIGAVSNLHELEAGCDRLRTSNNIFFAIRLDGRFDRVRTRAVSPPSPGGRLVDAARDQHEFDLTDVSGTLIGIWSPGFSSAFSVPGYHFHFLTEDRRHGGHVLECTAKRLRIRMEALNDFHLALPETEAFLKADLSNNSADELLYAEKSH
jgi:acetolactate decarboxylase